MLSVGLDLTSLAQRRSAASGPLLLDFTTGSLPGGVGLTRAGTGTVVTASGLLATVPANVPRFDHVPTTGAARGLLVEGATTNLCTASDAVTAAGWFSSGSTVLASAAATGPDGTVSASRVTFNDLNGYLYALASVSPGTTYSFSYFVKPETATRFYQSIYNHSAGNWIVWPVEYFPNSGTAYPAGWFRVNRVFTAPAGCTQVRIYPARPGSAGAMGHALLSGVQLEPGLVPSTPVRTTGTAANRAEDVLTLNAFSGTYDVTLTYASGAQTVLPGHAIFPGYRPVLAETRLASIALAG